MFPLQTIDQKPVYTEEELKEFQQKLAEEHSNVGSKVEELQQQRDLKEEEISLQVHHRSFSFAQ